MNLSNSSELNLNKKYKKIALCVIPFALFYLLDFALVSFLSSILYKFAGESYSQGIKLVYIIKTIMICPVVIYIFFDLYKNCELLFSKNNNSAILNKIVFYIIFSVIFEGFLSGIIYRFVNPIFNIFNYESGIINYAIHSSKILLISSTLLFIQFIIAVYFFIKKKYIICSFLFLIRQILFSIPLILIFYKVWNLKGILFAIPTADALSVLICIIIFTLSLKYKK